MREELSQWVTEAEGYFLYHSALNTEGLSLQCYLACLIGLQDC